MTSKLDNDPQWYKDAIIYELHVKSFFDSNEDGVGDFPGLIQKLDYLQELGITAVWLLPFYPSPLKDDGYDIADYLDVNPAYGTLSDFRQFVQEAHARGIRVITELVINHTSDQHPWFQTARQAPLGSVERDFYVWSDSDEKYDGVRIIFIDSEKSNWSWDPVAKQYYWHRFFYHQPDLNFENPRVRDSIFKILRYWLEMDVDGLRLDAVPYLVEREGTNCENLPETHAVLRELRAEVDANFANRMLLSEANQWPLDVLPYFGNGDECHMSFHFPLMPRIFMALRQEDRHPITEIMRQTPDIPESCQWALFLRNHDELTLEMVTNEERDYMYQQYAADPRARLNLGIRRRLAPLMDYSRQRVMLLNMLLFSLPGTPVIYYGDEIGMGDNIYLGDRNGVRTPMQWNGDRNGGFSRADFAKLYSAPIMDPVCGYQSVNVEAQERDPSSLLQWMKRLIALRKRSVTFGRGTLEFVHVRNRKILAYIRRYEDDVILCVANLSRNAQPAEIQLSAYAGRTPVEMVGGTEFPPIGQQPYFLSLAPHGGYWFSLQKTTTEVTAKGPAVHLEPVEAVPNLPIGRGWHTVLEGHARKLLEREILPGYIRQQRWFGSKTQEIRTVSLADWTLLQETRLPLASLAIMEVTLGDGTSAEYVLPLGVSNEAPTEPRAVVANLVGPDLQGVLFDATYDESVCQVVLDALADERELKTQKGVLRAQATSDFAELRGPADEPLAVTHSSAEQSNTSIRFGNRLMLKFFRRLSTGPNPDWEIGRYLTEEAHFTGSPKSAGAIEYVPSGEEPRTVALLQGLVRNQGDGWKHALDELGRYFDRALATRSDFDPQAGDHRPLAELIKDEPDAKVAEIIGPYLNDAATLGKRTAEMHLALGRRTNDPAFAPEPISPHDLGELASSMRNLAQTALQTLSARASILPENLAEQAHQLLGNRSKILKRFGELASLKPHAVKTRCHGDYHLGQVLWTENDYVIIDFEGEPARSLAERRAKQSPLKDVAGMLRSFDYAAHAGLFSEVGEHAEQRQRLEAWAATWKHWISASFLRAYLAAADDAPFLPKEPTQLFALLDYFILEKAMYELLYELNNRPDWVRIPLGGIVELLVF